MDGFTAYMNASYERAVGKNIISSQFQFDPGDLAYIAGHYIPLDHQQLFSLSAGASYLGEDTPVSGPAVWHRPAHGWRHAQRRSRACLCHGQFRHRPDFDLGGKGLTARFDILNALRRDLCNSRRHRHWRGPAAIRRPARLFFRACRRRSDPPPSPLRDAPMSVRRVVLVHRGAIG